MLADTFGRAATGSPQPPPGGGLQFASRRSARASPSARLRAFCGESIAVRPPQAAARRSFFTFNSSFFIHARNGRSGPQLRPAKARCSRPLVRALRKLQPDFSFFIAASQEVAAARSRPRAEGCSSTSQARPLGCGQPPSWNRSVRAMRSAGCVPRQHTHAAAPIPFRHKITLSALSGKDGLGGHLVQFVRF